MSALTSGERPEAEGAGTVRGKGAYGTMRPLAAYSVFPSDLPITVEEIHKVLAALGPDLAALFEEQG